MKDDASHWHYERRHAWNDGVVEMRNRLEKYQWYDVQIRICLNPLNWRVELERYWRGLRVMSFGPITVSIHYGE